MTSNADATYIQALRQLIEDYDAYIADIAPFTHKDGAAMKALHVRKDSLLALQPGEVLMPEEEALQYVEEVAPFTEEDWNRAITRHRKVYKR